MYISFLKASSDQYYYYYKCHFANNTNAVLLHGVTVVFAIQMPDQNGGYLAVR